MLASALKSARRMSHPSMLARTRVLAQQFNMSSAAPASASVQAEEPPVLFESDGFLRRYILNRPKKHNALDGAMISILYPKIKEWEQSELCRIVVGTGKGSSFCAGGDVVAVIKDGEKEETRPQAVDYFRQEFGLDFALAQLEKPYIVIMEGNTMGGGVGLSAHAPFRIATETTVFAMPETKIGYVPDVGASHFLPLLDGEIGTYLGLTGETIRDRAVFELGLATHFVPSRRVPQLLSYLASIDIPTHKLINAAIEDHYGEPLAEEARNPLVGDVRVALDTAFGHNTVEEIFSSLETMKNSDSTIVGEWAKKTLTALELRSPTGLKVALRAIRAGRRLTLGKALQMELGIASAFLTGASPDFYTGVNAVLVQKLRDTRPAWVPASLSEVTEDIVQTFFSPEAPKLDIEQEKEVGQNPMTFALPSEKVIGEFVRGERSERGDYAITFDELVERLRHRTHHKRGLEDKLAEVVNRKCELHDDPALPQRLRWKYD